MHFMYKSLNILKIRLALLFIYCMLLNELIRLHIAKNSLRVNIHSRCQISLCITLRHRIYTILHRLLKTCLKLKL
jgi:hypothetical protein